MNVKMFIKGLTKWQNTYKNYEEVKMTTDNWDVEN